MRILAYYYYYIMCIYTYGIRGKCQYLYLIKGSSSNKAAKTPITQRPTTIHIILCNTSAVCPRAFGFINYNIRGTQLAAFLSSSSPPSFIIYYVTSYYNIVQVPITFRARNAYTYIYYNMYFVCMGQPP